MKSKMLNQLILNVSVMLLVCCGSVFAATCYDPYYGYYSCNPTYYYNNYPDQDQAVLDGFLIGAVIGGFAGDGYGYGGHYRNGGWNGNWHGGGRHGGGGGHHH